MNFKKISLIFAIALTIAGSMKLPAFGMVATDANSQENEFNAVSESEISMDVSYGYDGNAKSGRFVPVNVTVKSDKDTPFTGTLRVEAMESDFDIYQYDYPVSLKGMEILDQSLDIPAGRADTLYVKLLDQSGNELIRKRLKTNVTPETAELFVGILSDNADKLSYMEGVGVNYSSVRIKTFNMKTEKMPDHVIGLGVLDVLVITDYDTKQLSKDQVSAIWAWVKEGGTLLLGTGARADDTLFAFQSDLLEKRYAPPAERSVDMGVEYSTNGPGDSFLNLVCADVSLKGGTGVFSNDQFSVLTSVSKGKGIVGVAAYDFADISSFCETHRSYVDKLFTTILGDTRLNNLSSYLYSGNSGQFWSVQNMLNTGNVDKLPKLALYIVLILGYIILVGPGLYLYLKKKERRGYYRTAVVVISFIFTAVIYLTGIKTRFKDTFFTYATILDSTKDYVDEYTYINMRTPYNKAYTISLDPSYMILPITRSNNYEMSPVPKFLGDEDYKVRVGYGNGDTKVSVQNAAAFTPKYFSLQKRTPNTDHRGLLGDITLSDGKVYGTVTNEYPFPVEKVGVLMYGKMILLDELKPGETVKLDGAPVINYPINNAFNVSARVTGSYQYPKADIDNPDYMLALSRTNILSFYLDKYSTAYNQEARIVAFSSNQTDSQFLAKGIYETFGMSMFTSTLDVNTRKYGVVSHSALIKPPKVISGQYYSDSNATYAVDPVALEYFLGNDLEIDKLSFENPSADFTNNDNVSYINLFKGDIYFYNHDTGNYDVMTAGKLDYTAGELTPYLSPGNTLTVKYVSDNAEGKNWYITLPMLTVTGRDK